MKVLRIDRLSIKRNPNAGNTTTYYHGATTATFHIESNDIPKWLSEEPFIPTEWIYGSDNNIIEMSGIVSVIDMELVNKLQGIKGLNLTIDKDVNVIHHAPEPNYLYEYLPLSLKCKFCKNYVDTNEIQVDYIITDSGDMKIEECPICHHENTFPEYRAETISEVLKKFNITKEF